MMKRLILCLLVLLPVTAHAHPHMLLLTRLTCDFHDRTCTGVEVDWGFDRFFSQSVIDDFDLDYNGLFDEEETREVYALAFINLEKYGYFLYFRKGNERIQPDEVTDFSVRQRDGQVFYTFYVPVKDMNLASDFSISVFDPTYFCAVRYQEEPVVLRQTGEERPEYEFVENRDYPVYYDPMGAAGDTTTYDSWKPGLETAYPEEVHVYFE